MKDLSFRLDIKPLSVNKAWQGKRFKTPEYNSYQTKCMLLMPNKKVKFSDMIRIEFVFGFSSKLADLDNPVKLLQDIACKKYGFDDRDVWEINIQKKIVPKGYEYVNMRISNYLPFNT